MIFVHFFVTIYRSPLLGGVTILKNYLFIEEVFHLKTVLSEVLQNSKKEKERRKKRLSYTLKFSMFLTRKKKEEQGSKVLQNYKEDKERRKKRFSYPLKFSIFDNEISITTISTIHQTRSQ